MQPKNSTGIDEISISVVKSSSDYILFGLCHIFNLSLSQGQFIIDFKKAKVIPVHKKGKKTNVNNYRPISLLPVLSQILEKIVHRLYSFLSQSKFFYDLQFGFRKNHSTSHAATVVVVIQFFIRCFPFSRDGRIYPIPSAILRTPSLHLSRLRASSFFKPIFSVSSSTCFFQVFFGRPRFLLPVTSRFRATLKTLSSSLLSTCPCNG